MGGFLFPLKVPTRCGAGLSPTFAPPTDTAVQRHPDPDISLALAVVLGVVPAVHTDPLIRFDEYTFVCHGVGLLLFIRHIMAYILF